MWGHPVWCVTENARFPLFTKLFSVIKLLLKARPIGEEMKRHVSIASLLTVLIMASTLITENAFAAGMKKAGPLVATSSTINTLLTGSTPPTSSVGKNGDVYIDVKNAILYGPKKKGVWPLGVSLKGNDGKSGIDGKNGSDGKAGAVSATTTAGPAGPQGPKGDVGPAGPAGADGANGSAGPAGQPGVAGADGAQGPRGETGPQGLKGDAGVSKAIKKTIPTFSLMNTAGTSNQSAAFGNLEAGKSYEFTLILHGVTTAVGKYFGIDVLSTDSQAPAIFDAMIAESKTYDVSAAGSSHRYSFYVTGTITAGVGETSLIVKIFDGDGSTAIAGQGMTVTGKAYFIEVNSIN